MRYTPAEKAIARTIADEEKIRKYYICDEELEKILNEETLEKLNSFLLSIKQNISLTISQVEKDHYPDWSKETAYQWNSKNIIKYLQLLEESGKRKPQTEELTKNFLQRVERAIKRDKKRAENEAQKIEEIKEEEIIPVPLKVEKKVSPTPKKHIQESPTLQKKEKKRPAKRVLKTSINYPEKNKGFTPKVVKKIIKKAKESEINIRRHINLYYSCKFTIESPKKNTREELIKIIKSVLSEPLKPQEYFSGKTEFFTVAHPLGFQFLYPEIEALKKELEEENIQIKCDKVLGGILIKSEKGNRNIIKTTIDKVAFPKHIISIPKAQVESILRKKTIKNLMLKKAEEIDVHISLIEPQGEDVIFEVRTKNPSPKKALLDILELFKIF